MDIAEGRRPPHNGWRPVHAAISVRLEVSVSMDPGANPAVLEDAIAEEGRRAARELYAETIRMLDAEAAAASGTRQRREQRWVATLMGRVRITRYRVRSNGSSYHPLDRALGLSRSEVSPALRRTIVALGRDLPHRQVARIVTVVTGEPLSTQTVWRVLKRQANGRR